MADHASARDLSTRPLGPFRVSQQCGDGLALVFVDAADAVGIVGASGMQQGVPLSASTSEFHSLPFFSDALVQFLVLHIVQVLPYQLLKFKGFAPPVPPCDQLQMHLLVDRI